MALPLAPNNARVLVASPAYVAASIQRGELVHVNPHWGGEPSPLYLVVPGRAQLTTTARALKDWLQAHLDN